MKILAIDTATEACSAAVYVDGAVFERYELAPQRHSALILDFCDEVLGQSGCTLQQMDVIAFGRGPGSFTGVRIATGVAQGIALATDRPVVPISTLAAIAYGVYRTEGAQNVLAAIDARMQEIYWAAYQCRENQADTMDGEFVSSPDSISISSKSTWVCAGSGGEKYRETISAGTSVAVDKYSTFLFPHAQDIAVLAAEQFRNGIFVSAEQAAPVYLRDNVTHAPRTT